MEFWDRIAKLYDFAECLNGKVYNEMLEITRQLVPLHSRVLECAAGTGELSLAAAIKAKSVVCTDNSEKMLGVAKRKANKQGAYNITFERQNIFALDHPDESFDVVIAGNVLHLLDDPEKALTELWRVTKRGGRILLPTFMTQNKSAASGTMLKLYTLLGYRASTEYTPRSYVFMLKSCALGRVKAKLIKGTMPCCYAVIVKD